MSALLEKILSRDNMFAALDKVKANKGAGGIDGIYVDEIDQYLRDNWVDLRDKIVCFSSSSNYKSSWNKKPPAMPVRIGDLSFRQKRPPVLR